MKLRAPVLILNTEHVFYAGEFSNFFNSPFEVGGQTFFCVEQFMMYSKAKIMGDDETAKQIMRSTSPGNIRKLGRKVTPYDDELWSENRYDLVKIGVYHKFDQNEDLKELILSFGNRTFVEASPTDRIWGIGVGLDEPIKLVHPELWRGENLLGKVLTDVRDMLVGAK